MSDKPVYHGRDHRLGGADPINDPSVIHFDTDPQAGDWLLVTTTGTHGGHGVYFNDTGGGGIQLDTSDLFEVNADSVAHGDYAIKMAAARGIVSVEATDGLLVLSAAGADTGNLEGQIHLGARNYIELATASVAMGEGNILFWLSNSGVAAGANLLVASGSGGTPLFKIDANGTIHGKASVGSITWDL